MKGDLEGQHSHLRPSLEASVLLCAPYSMTQFPGSNTLSTTSPVEWGSPPAPHPLPGTLLPALPGSYIPCPFKARRALSLFLPGGLYKPQSDNQL